MADPEETQTDLVPPTPPSQLPKRFDVVVLGSGSAAAKVAKAAAKAGQATLCVENRDFGGTCALRGCNPKKVLVRAAELVERCELLRGKAVPGEHGVRFDWATAHAFQQTFTEPVPKSTRDGLVEAGVTITLAQPKLLGPNRVQLQSSDGDATREIAFDRLVIGTGAKPAKLPFAGGELALDSDDFLSLESLPKRIVFLGGGYISSEFAHVCLIAGCEVSIIERGPRILDHFDPDMTARLEAHSRSRGMKIFTQSDVQSIERSGAGFCVQFELSGTDGESQEHTVEADLVVQGLGRVPAVDTLGLDAAAIAFDDDGVTVNDQCRSTTQRHVWAVGDCAAHGQPMLTPTANETARCVARQFGGEADATPDFGPIPYAAFTLPPLASVGLHETEAREKLGDRLRVRHEEMDGWTTFRKTGAKVAAYKTLLDADSGRIVGAHFIGVETPELVNYFALAMKTGLTRSDLKSLLFTYPTLSSEVRAMV